MTASYHGNAVIKAASFLFLLISTCFLPAHAGELSVSGIDGTGRPVALKSPARRIVSLGPAATETLWAIGAGDAMAARTELCDWPPEALKVPSLGGFDGRTISVERILSFRPDLVIAYDGMHNHLVNSLERYGIPVYVSRAESVEGTLNEILTLGVLTGHADEAADVTDGIRAELAEITLIVDAIPESARRRVYWELWYGPCITAGNTSFIGNLIERAGGINIFGDTAAPYPQVSEESIIRRNPQVILIPSDAAGSDPGSRVLWRSTDAVLAGRVYRADANLVSRSGPRVGKAARYIAELIYPEYLGDAEPQ